MAVGKLLLIDDSKTVRDQLTFDLRDLPFSAILEADDGQSGLNVALAEPELGLIILDLNMPGMDGVDFLVELDKSGSHKKTPKVMLTTVSNIELKVKCKGLGVVAWVTKPYDADLLRAAITEILNKRTQG